MTARQRQKWSRCRGCAELEYCGPDGRCDRCRRRSITRRHFASAAELRALAQLSRRQADQVRDAAELDDDPESSPVWPPDPTFEGPH